MSQPIHTYIELYGVKLEVVGTYYKGEPESSDSPGEEPSVDVDAVLTESGDDIGVLFGANKELQAELEEVVMRDYDENMTWAKTEAALARRELAREES
jgi:hypothetical protein